MSYATENIFIINAQQKPLKYSHVNTFEHTLVPAWTHTHTHTHSQHTYTHTSHNTHTEASQRSHRSVNAHTHRHISQHTPSFRRNALFWSELSKFPCPLQFRVDGSLHTQLLGRQRLLNPILRAYSSFQVTDQVCRLPLHTFPFGQNAANLGDLKRLLQRVGLNMCLNNIKYTYVNTWMNINIYIYIYIHTCEYVCICTLCCWTNMFTVAFIVHKCKGIVTAEK